MIDLATLVRSSSPCSSAGWSVDPVVADQLGPGSPMIFEDHQDSVHYLVVLF